MPSHAGDTKCLPCRVCALLWILESRQFYSLASSQGQLCADVHLLPFLFSLPQTCLSESDPALLRAIICFLAEHTKDSDLPLVALVRVRPACGHIIFSCQESSILYTFALLQYKLSQGYFLIIISSTDSGDTE